MVKKRNTIRISGTPADIRSASLMATNFIWLGLVIGAIACVLVFAVGRAVYDQIESSVRQQVTEELTHDEVGGRVPTSTSSMAAESASEPG